MPKPLTAADGSFNSTTEALAGSVATTGLAVGRHTVYVRARDAGGAWGPVSAVFLNINSVPTLQLAEVEPNNTLDAAQLVPSLPAQVSGSMDERAREVGGDADVFRLTLPAGRTLAAAVTPNTGTSCKLELLDAKGGLLASSAPSVSQVAQASTANGSGAAVTLFVRVSFPVGPRSSEGGLYTLGLTLP